MKRALQFFVFSVIIMLMLTSVAKAVTLWQSPQLLKYENPVLRISEKAVLALAITMELMTIALILLTNNTRGKLWLIVWVGLIFLIYRGFSYISPRPPKMCPCLGNLEWLGVSDANASSLSGYLLTYMLIGASTLLLYRQRSPILSTLD